MYIDSDFAREYSATKSSLEGYRTEFSRDLSRLKHSNSFRRLQGKTQLFPDFESDFFRNRLTHSIEVSDIAKNIAMKVNNEHLKDAVKIDLDLVEFAGLAHDLGHPPFGHIGEKALNEKMKELGGFEGNGQTLRILARIEKKQFGNGGDIMKQGFSEEGDDLRLGLNLTYRTLASILKYDKVVSKSNSKGYYSSEKDLVEKIKDHVLNNHVLAANTPFKTVECSIMDLADDIAYTTYDMEDSLKGNFVNILDFLSHSDNEQIIKVLKKTYEGIVKANQTLTTENQYDDSKFVNIKSIIDIEEKMKDTDADIVNLSIEKTKNEKAALKNEWKSVLNILLKFFKNYGFSQMILNYNIEVLEKLNEKFNPNKEDALFEYTVRYTALNHSGAKLLSENGYLRTEFSTALVKYFLKNINFQENKDCVALSSVFMNEDAFVVMEYVKHYIFYSQTKSPRIQIADYRGKEIVNKIFDTLNENSNLLPIDIKKIYDISKTPEEKARIICDFIANMTNKYAIEFYGRLTSENPETIFKPI